MKIGIENVSKSFCEFWEVAQGLKLEEQLELWKRTYGAETKEVFDHFCMIMKDPEGGNNLDREIEESLRMYESEYPNIKSIGNEIDGKIEGICNSCSEILGIDDIELKFISMVGLFFANAFVTGYNGGTAFYFLEKIGTPKTLGIILAHEITHLFHFSQISRENHDQKLGESIFIEGLACFMSKELFPGFETCDYLYIHEDKWDGWRAKCSETQDEIKEDILNNMEREDRGYAKKYLNTNDDENSRIPERIGYLIGYLAVEELIESHSLNEMVRWDTDRVIEEMKGFIQKNII